MRLRSGEYGRRNSMQTPNEKTGKSEHKFRLIIRLGNTCQVTTSYILLEIPCSIRGSGVSSTKGSKGDDR